MKGHEITFALKTHGSKVKNIAAAVQVSSSAVTQVIYGQRKSSKIREAISIAINKPDSEMLPEIVEAEWISER